MPTGCIICKRVLKNVLNTTDIPVDALMCQTTGNYGSGVHDSIDESGILVFNICDGCFVKLGDEGLIQKYTPISQVEYKFEPWKFEV